MIKKRLTILFFIVSMLSYSSVWAMHNHDDGLSHAQGISSVDSHVTGTQHTLDDDHCCHASAHMIGLFATNFGSLLPVRHIDKPDYSVYQFTHITSPPQKPPLV